MRLKNLHHTTKSNLICLAFMRINMASKLFLFSSLSLLFHNCSNKTKTNNLDNKIENSAMSLTNSNSKLPETEEKWKERLTPEEFHILREKGTERPYSGEYYNHNKSGIYVCKGCGTELFKSEAKFDAHCGWPSFYEGIDKSKIKETIDRSHGMIRTEVTCANCGGHLGHVFDDGPQDKTGLRYCINSVSLGFVSKENLDTTQLNK